MQRARLIVDGMNVIGSRPDRWWRDRKGAMHRLVSLLEAYASERDAEVTVVFDSKPFAIAGEGRVDIVFASDSPRNAADDEIVRMLEREPEPESIQVVTSDAELASRVEALGAAVVGSGGFRERLEQAGG